ncbi:MAG: fused MFS/spermidine synthase [Lachnospiraceae bacterium]|nr:fused MFS/spermidine synthase [Lachnospiraceae bacterium]
MQKDILERKWYLYLTEFFSGMALMAVELGASRLIAPYFSSSQIVWTIIIGTIMIAMALGNVFGGRWADKDPDPSRLFRRIMIAAVWIAAIPLVGKYIIVAITGVLIIAVDTNLLIWAAFLTCMILFVFPLFLLGTVTPSLIRATVSDLKESGSIAGKLGACNTIGSIIGTFVPTFVSIPAVGTSATFLIFSGILLAISLAYFIFRGGGKKAAAVSVILFVLCSLFGHTDHFAFWENGLTYEGESIYNYLQVKEDDRQTVLSTNVLFGVQSIRMKNEGLTGMYYDYALAAPVMAGKKDPKVLILGMGTGTYAAQLQRYFPEADIVGVEIDEKITDLAHTYFDLDASIPVATYDGRAYLNVDTEKYDVIMVDAYQDITIPFQMSSVEFFTLVKDHLADDGVMVVNLNMFSADENNIASYLADTISGVFPCVTTADVIGSTNRELFASVNDSAKTGLLSNTDTLENAELKAMMTVVAGGLSTWESENRILTDDQAPVELLGMQTIDAIIKDEVGYYKNLYEEGGLGGLIAELA